MPASHASEAQILHDVMLALGGRPDVYIARRNVGFARSPSGRVVKFGVVGEADLQGVLRVFADRGPLVDRGPLLGLAFALECKTWRGRLSLAQDRWRLAWTKRGGLYAVVRSADEAVAAIEAWKRGDR